MTMPLRDLVEYFNQRISAEQGLAEPPLFVHAGQVESTINGVRLATEFHPIRKAAAPSDIIGHDATLQESLSETHETAARALFSSKDEGGIINLDRLCRTIHMLNYLPISHENGYLFVHVHPRHVLGVKRDHGAYFEEVIFRCGLSPRRVVITVTVTPVYDRQLSVLLDGLKNYQARGYSIAIKFDEQADDAFFERYCIEFLHRVTPDFVRLGSDFFSNPRLAEGDRRPKSSLLSVIHQLDTQLLLEGVKDPKAARLAEILRAGLVKGEYYENQVQFNAQNQSMQGCG
jgi:EAL domain-containing protein (putative c-di-GMP-specific phosphodiesterase class I)